MSPLIRVTKEFPFEMAHVLWNYDGPCKNVHGHSYRLFVTLSGVPADNQENPKNGMVIDFSDLKSIIKNEIVNIFDHSVVLSNKIDKEKTDLFSKMLEIPFL
jgi:6-pyruvoyltetrahydropterin/6-carboxytetrahydropterin synthase